MDNQNVIFGNIFICKTKHTDLQQSTDAARKWNAKSKNTGNSWHRLTDKRCG